MIIIRNTNTNNNDKHNNNDNNDNTHTSNNNTSAARASCRRRACGGSPRRRIYVSMCNIYIYIHIIILHHVTSYYIILYYIIMRRRPTPPRRRASTTAPWRPWTRSFGCIFSDGLSLFGDIFQWTVTFPVDFDLPGAPGSQNRIKVLQEVLTISQRKWICRACLPKKQYYRAPSEPRAYYYYY